MYVDAVSTNLLHLIGQDTVLLRVASTKGGEWAGACFWCGGKDRLRVWPNADHPGWWCRVCEKHGDAIDYLRQKGMTFHEACRELGMTPDRETPEASPAYQPPPVIAPPCAAWQDRATAWLEEAQEALWSDGGERALDWLARRGFTKDTILRAGLGYQADDAWQPREDWGIDATDDTKNVWLPRGIVIPWQYGGALWKVTIRRPAGEPKYITVNASANALYNADELVTSEPGVLVEGAFDALAVQQETGIAAVASGTTGARGWLWVQRLSLSRPILVALDADEAGDSGARWWCDVLQARRWRPILNDPAEMLERGVDLVPWIEAGLEVSYASV